MEVYMYDIIIIGAGPAGLTAAIYARRAGKTVLVLERSSFGGQMTFSPKIENYPGYAEISGVELADKMVDQALTLGAEIEPCNVLGVVRDEARGAFSVETDDGERLSRAVIIAAGAAHRRLGLEGEGALIGHGISFCAVCDGAFYKDRRVAVIGGGNSAIVEAAMLADVASEVYVIQDMPTLTGEAAAAAALAERENVHIRCGCRVDGYIENGGRLCGLSITSPNGSDELFVDGVFIAIGLKPENEPFAAVTSTDARGYIISDETTEVAVSGVFVAGDCRNKSVRQISTATADGAVAALAAAAYIDNLAK